MDELSLEKPRTTFCRAMARRALQSCSSAFAQGWPHDIDLAAQLVLPGFKVFELESLPRGVCAIVDTEDRSIGVNTTLPKAKKRFAIAHEIGHVYLNHPLYTCTGRERQSSILESEANLFASEFLIPLASLRREFKFCRDYTILAETFAVDKEIMYYRFKETGLLRQVL